MSKRKIKISSNYSVKPKRSRTKYKLAKEKPASPSVYLEKAFAQLQKGKKQEAQALLKKLLKIAHEDPFYLNRLGVLAHLLGKSDSALELLFKSVTISPFAPFYNNLGLVQEELCRYTDAQKSYMQALDLDPNIAEAHYNLGNVFQKTGQYSKAEEEYIKALALKQDYPSAYSNLGYAQLELGLFDKAEASCKTALRQNPSFVEAMNCLAKIELARGHFTEGLKISEKAVNLAPENPEAVELLCNLHIKLGHIETAIEICRNALKTARRRDGLYAVQGYAYAILGNKQEAVKSYRHALTLAPDNFSVHQMLSMVKKFVPGDEDISRMKKIYEAADGEKNKYRLCFAMGKAYEDCGDYTEAFKYIEEGNRLLRETYSYTLDNEIDFFNKIKSVFNADFIRNARIHGCKDTTPIFIVGMPRSGTSLVEQIIAAHPEVYGAGELLDLDIVIRQKLQTKGYGNFPEGLTRLTPQDFGWMGSEYINRLRKHQGISTPRIVDKRPHNFCFIGLIHIILPHAKIIHCKRNPLDTCWSIYKNFFDIPHKYAQDQKELGGYYLLYLDLMKHWHQVLPPSIYEVEYEKLIEDHEGETRKLLHYCDLTWDKSCLDFHALKRPVQTASFLQVRQPIYKDSVNKWQFYKNKLKTLSAIINGASK